MSPVHLLKLGSEVLPIVIVLTIPRLLGQLYAHLMQHTIPLDHCTHYNSPCHMETILEKEMYNIHRRRLSKS